MRHTNCDCSGIIAVGNVQFTHLMEDIMESTRAKEILESPEMVYVTYQNLPVWIDDVKDSGEVEIRDLNSDIQMNVSANDLREIENIEPNHA